MKKLLVAASCFALAVAAYAQSSPDLADNGHSNIKKFYARGYARPGGGGSQNLLYHTGGSVIRNANVVFIFWGPSFGQGGADAGYAGELQNFRNQFGTTGEYNTISQYYGEDAVSGYGNIATGSLSGQGDWFDTSTPPTNVTDATVQSEVNAYISNFGVDYNAVYEVVIPRTSYSSDGSSTSCGGPNLAYCAYHGYYQDSAGKFVKYSIEPWPGCSGCQVTGFTAAQNQQHFVTHETREAVTDPLLNSWYDRRGYEADDKCAWTPTPFIGTGGYAYQYEWSNADNGCVKTK